MIYTQQVAQAIITKLQGVSNLNGVYGTEIPTPTSGQYPFATVIIKSGTGKFGDLTRNERTFKYDINVYQERTIAGQGPTQSEIIITSLIDEIITAFDMDFTLSGVAKFVKPLDFDASYVMREMGDTRILKFNVEATVVTPASG